MVASSLNPFLVEVLHLVLVILLLFKAGQCHIHHLQRVADASPAFSHDLGALLVAHTWELGLDLCSSLAFVHTIGTYLLEGTVFGHVNSLKDLSLLGFKLFLLAVDALL